MAKCWCGEKVKATPTHAGKLLSHASGLRGAFWQKKSRQSRHTASFTAICKCHILIKIKGKIKKRPAMGKDLQNGVAMGGR